jgi:hypothetical protein
MWRHKLKAPTYPAHAPPKGPRVQALRGRSGLGVSERRFSCRFHQVVPVHVTLLTPAVLLDNFLGMKASAESWAAPSPRSPPSHTVPKIEAEKRGQYVLLSQTLRRAAMPTNGQAEGTLKVTLCPACSV